MLSDTNSILHTYLVSVQCVCVGWIFKQCTRMAFIFDLFLNWSIKDKVYGIYDVQNVKYDLDYLSCVKKTHVLIIYLCIRALVRMYMYVI